MHACACTPLHAQDCMPRAVEACLVCTPFSHSGVGCCGVHGSWPEKQSCMPLCVPRFLVAHTCTRVRAHALRECTCMSTRPWAPMRAHAGHCQPGGQRALHGVLAEDARPLPHHGPEQDVHGGRGEGARARLRRSPVSVYLLVRLVPIAWPCKAMALQVSTLCLAMQAWAHCARASPWQCTRVVAELQARVCMSMRMPCAQMPARTQVCLQGNGSMGVAMYATPVCAGASPRPKLGKSRFWWLG